MSTEPRETPIAIEVVNRHMPPFPEAPAASADTAGYRKWRAAAAEWKKLQADSVAQLLNDGEDIFNRLKIATTDSTITVGQWNAFRAWLEDNGLTIPVTGAGDTVFRWCDHWVYVR